jgi:uncharacterized membrane protein (DUF485 family)
MRFVALVLGVGLLAWAAFLRSPLFHGNVVPWAYVSAIALGGLGWIVAAVVLSFGEVAQGHLQDTTLDKLLGTTVFAPLSGRAGRSRRRLF